jgi:hypothetical protein
MRELRMKNLIVLSCNPGAYKGNYLEGTLWKMFYFPLQHYAKFAAVDSIISLLHDDGLGALVLHPEELNRVKGFDVKATFEMFNPTRSKGLDRLVKHTECLKVGIERIFSQYERVFVAVNSSVYQMCMAAAIEETNQWHKVRFYDMLAGCWNKTKVLNILQKDILATNFVSGIVPISHRETIEKKYIDRWTKYRKVVPERWKYWDKETKS